MPLYRRLPKLKGIAGGAPPRLSPPWTRGGILKHATSLFAALRAGPGLCSP